MKINKIHKPMNTLYDNKQPKVYDIVMVYCRYCQEKMEIHVHHSLGKFEHFQLINLPERIAKHLTNMMGGTIAVVTAVLVVNPPTDPEWVWWILPTVLITPVITWWNKKVLN